MIKLPEFCYLTNKQEAKGKEFILYTKYPYYLFEVVFIHNEEEEKLFLSENEGGIFTNITGYKIYLSWTGTVTGKLPLQKETTDHIQKTILKISNYYYEQRIQHNAGRYSNFIIKH